MPNRNVKNRSFKQSHYKAGSAHSQQYNASVPLTVFFHATQKLKRVVKQLEDAANEAESAAAIEVLHHIQAGV